MALPFTRTLRVRNAEGVADFGAQAGGPGSFEALLRLLLRQNPMARGATDGDRSVYLLHEQTPADGVYLHIVAWRQNEPVTTMGDPAFGHPAHLQPFPPPANSQYIDATLLYVVQGNNVYCCRSGTRTDSPLIAYVTQASIAAGLAAAAYQFELQDRANLDKIRAVQRDGIKTIKFNGAASLGAIAEAQRDTATKSIIGGLVDQLRSGLGDGLQQARPAANTKVEVKLIVDSRQAVIGHDPIVQAIAQRAIRDGDEGFRIVTRGNKTITADDVVLSKSAVLNPLGKHPDHQNGWAALSDYRDELNRPQP